MFESENDLVQAVITAFEKDDICNRFVSTDETKKVFTEINLGYGVADVVVACLEISCGDRKRCLKQLEFILYNYIYKEGEATLDTLEKTTKFSKYILKRSLSRLIEDGFISDDSDTFTIKKEYMTSIKSSMGVEVKLSNWKRALKQAFRYKWFAECAFVVMPESNVRPALNNLEEFKKLKVGLASMDDQEQIKIYYKPIKSPPLDKIKVSLFNEYILFNS